MRDLQKLDFTCRNCVHYSGTDPEDKDTEAEYCKEWMWSDCEIDNWCSLGFEATKTAEALNTERFKGFSIIPRWDNGTPYYHICYENGKDAGALSTMREAKNLCRILLAVGSES